MKASEIYKLPTKREQSWTSLPDDLTGAVFNLDIYSSYDLDDDASPLRGHEKLSMNLEPNYHWLYIYALEFEGTPFAVVSRSATEKSGNDHEVLVTDRAVFDKARAHVISLVYGKVDESLFGNAEDEIELDLHGAVIARYADGPRLAKRSEVGFGSSEPIFDMEKLDRDHRAKVWSLQNKEGRGLRSETGVALAKEIIGDAILRGRKTLVGEWVRDTDWFAGFYEADGIVYDMHASSYTLSGDAMNWDSHLNIGYLCHGKFYEVLDRAARTNEVDMTDPAAADVRDAFGLTDEEAARIISDVAHGREDDFLSAAVETLFLHDPRPEKFSGMDHPVFGVARLLSEDEELVRFGLGGMSSLAYARDYWRQYQDTLARRASEEAVDAVEEASPAPRG